MIITPLMSAETCAGRERVRARQPHVQRHHAGLGAEADQRGDRDERPAARRAVERVTAERAVLGQHEQRDPRPGARQVRDRDVDEDAPARRLLVRARRG